MSTQRTILITGGNRGIGLSLARSFHAQGFKVIVGVREISKAPQLDGVIAVKIDSASETDARDAVEELKSKYDIETLDVVIANAGMGSHYAPMKDIDLAEFRDHYRVNTQGPLVLFQAVYPLLKEGSKFIIISSALGSIGLDHDPNVGVYGSSKAAVGYLGRQIHFEEPHLISFFIDPGWLDTAMGQYVADQFGVAKPPMKVEDIIPQLVKLINNATRENTSGYFWK
ncbi:uncharacterized protein IL334_000601 [Kwoniella shivajii]|uniref:NAD(P)-binding protein n=1 Tax=Kwoniella shivajii TaxID=564305 RepID=A0ABZ1CPS5_9TREE|nr:hypothetical protein IL334_000601 [Kwoniella shivajii]